MHQPCGEATSKEQRSHDVKPGETSTFCRPMTEISTRKPFNRPGGLPELANRMISLAVLPGDRPDLIRTKRLFTAAMWASIVTSVVSVYQLFVFDAPWAAAAVGIAIVAAVITLVLLWLRPTTFPAVMHIVVLGTMITNTAVTILYGGIDEAAGNALWAVLVVVGAVAIFADRRAFFWLAVFVVNVVGASIVADRVDPRYVQPEESYLSLFNLVVVTVFIFVVLYYFVRQSARLYRQSEGLLRNILPNEIADRLKASDDMIADEFPAASILFADIAGFTPIASQLEPGETVNLLNDVFTAFDQLVAARGLEKIKTIGDAYMVASGVPAAREDHAEAICDLALDIQEHLKSNTLGGRQIEMRIGIASGPVMAGIIGRQKFSYDLWGDTVNLASRMESTGIPGRIQMPAATRELVGELFVWEERGFVDVKGRGPIDTCFLVGRAPVPLMGKPDDEVGRVGRRFTD